MPKMLSRPDCAYQFQYNCLSGRILSYSTKKELYFHVKLHNKKCELCKDRSISTNYFYKKNKAINTVPSNYYNQFK